MNCWRCTIRNISKWYLEIRKYLVRLCGAFSEGWRVFCESSHQRAEQDSVEIKYDNSSYIFASWGLDDGQAADLARKAAEQGVTRAQYDLGMMYVMGKGMETDEQQAAVWFRKAAEQGDAEAQYNLGVKYEGGQGVPQDYKLAYIWFSVAAANGYVNAVKGRDRLAPILPPAVLIEAQELAGKYFEQYQPQW